MKGDGNCYLRCIAFVLTGSEDDHLRIRNFIIDHMRKLDSKLQEYINSTVETYLDESNMNQNQIWATDAEIMGTGTANALGIDVYLYTWNSKMGKEWLRYPSSFTLVSPRTDHAIYLDNPNGNPFDVVLDVGI